MNRHKIFRSVDERVVFCNKVNGRKLDMIDDFKGGREIEENKL